MRCQKHKIRYIMVVIIAIYLILTLVSVIDSNTIPPTNSRAFVSSIPPSKGEVNHDNNIAVSLDDIVENTFGSDVDGLPSHHRGNSEQLLPNTIKPNKHVNMHAEQVSSSIHTLERKQPQRENAFTCNEDDLSQVDKDYIFEGLKQLYRKKVLPLEIATKYSHFASPPMGPSDFDAKPMVLILGQYSVGKTSFIRSLLQQDFPGQRIGPEPTTDRFTAIMHTENGPQQSNRLLPGHALVMQASKPFRGLASYGNNFLSKFEGAEVNASILRNITIVDTPGVLAGEKQRLGRDYDFSEVVKWFADRADMIIIMFDAHKLDISDELRTVLEVLKPHQAKIRVLLNKADTVDTQALLRVYGALMWALGKVIGTPEVVRVYLGSFWEAPLKLQDNRALLEREKHDLIQEMMSLPQNAIIRRINELVKRARSVKVHAYIIHYLKKQMPYVIGKSDKQRKLLERLDREFIACARRYNLPIGDFPNVDLYRKMLREIKDISDFKRLDKNLVYEMDRVLTHDIPLLLQKATAKSNKVDPTGSGSVTMSQFMPASDRGSSSFSRGGSYNAYNPFYAFTGNSKSRAVSSSGGSRGQEGGGMATFGNTNTHPHSAAVVLNSLPTSSASDPQHQQPQQQPYQQPHSQPPGQYFSQIPPSTVPDSHMYPNT